MENSPGKTFLLILHWYYKHGNPLTLFKLISDATMVKCSKHQINDGLHFAPFADELIS